MSDSVNVISDKMLALVHDATRAAYDFAIAIELRHNVKAAMLADERSLRALAEAIAELEAENARLKAENAKLKAEIEQRADHESYLSQEFANTYYEKNARIAELEAERRWIPVSERLPEEKQSVLALDRTGTAYHWEYSKCLSNIFVGYYTHWMPLPEPPEVKE